LFRPIENVTYVNRTDRNKKLSHAEKRRVCYAFGYSPPLNGHYTTAFQAPARWWHGVYRSWWKAIW